MQNSHKSFFIVLAMMISSSALAVSTASDLEKIESETLVLKARQKQLDVQAQIAAKENEIASKQMTRVGYRSAHGALPQVRSIEGIGKTLYATLQYENGALVDVKSGDILENGMKVVSVQPNVVEVETENKHRLRLETSSSAATPYQTGNPPPLPFSSPSQGFRGLAQ